MAGACFTNVKRFARPEVFHAVYSLMQCMPHNNEACERDKPGTICRLVLHCRLELKHIQQTGPACGHELYYLRVIHYQIVHPFLSTPCHVIPRYQLNLHVLLMEASFCCQGSISVICFGWGYRYMIDHAQSKNGTLSRQVQKRHTVQTSPQRTRSRINQ